jgi:endoglucanase
MNKLIISLNLLILLIITFGYQRTEAQQSTEVKIAKRWWEIQQWAKPKVHPEAQTLPLIKVAGKTVVNEDGDTILFRGVAISDPDMLEAQGHWQKKHFDKIQELGAKIVRIPVHPAAWRERTSAAYLELLDQAVQWCTELNMYVIIDWHSIGNLQMELFQNPMYETTKKETYEFWRAIAANFTGHNAVAFYEIFNEPTIFNGLLGNMNWSEWKKINEDIIRLIRAYDLETIPLVAGFDWAYDLTPLHIDPVNAEGIAYVTHPYSIKRSEPWEPKWEEDFAFAATRYPVIATEFGFNLKDSEVVDQHHYANRIINFLEERGISWVCWVFDPDWSPKLFKSWDTYELTGAGEFFKKAFQNQNKQ